MLQFFSAFFDFLGGAGPSFWKSQGPCFANFAKFSSPLCYNCVIVKNSRIKIDEKAIGIKLIDGKSIAITFYQLTLNAAYHELGFFRSNLRALREKILLLTGLFIHRFFLAEIRKDYILPELFCVLVSQAFEKNLSEINRCSFHL